MGKENINKNRVNLLPVLESLFGISKIKSKEELDKLIGVLEEMGDKPLFKDFTIEELAERVADSLEGKDLEDAEMEKEIDALIEDAIEEELEDMKEAGVDVTREQIAEGIQETAEAMQKE